MLDRIQSFFNDIIQAEVADAAPDTHAHGIRLATAALLIEMARADFDASDQERLLAGDLIAGRFGLTQSELDELMSLAELEVREAASLYEFTRLIDKRLSYEEKQEVVGMLWEMAYADGVLDKYEEHLVRKLTDLLHIPHQQMMRLKHAVRERLGIEEF